jgi:hypothetical protein
MLGLPDMNMTKNANSFGGGGQTGRCLGSFSITQIEIAESAIQKLVCSIIPLVLIYRSERTSQVTIEANKESRTHTVKRFDGETTRHPDPPSTQAHRCVNVWIKEILAKGFNNVSRK